jgi:integrase
VFPNTEGAPMNHFNFRGRVFVPALRRARLRRVRVHDMRHTCASLLIAAGCDIAAVNRQLGRANVATTAAVYSHWFAKRSAIGLGARLEAFVAQETAPARQRATLRNRERPESPRLQNHYRVRVFSDAAA